MKFAIITWSESIISLMRAETFSSKRSRLSWLDNNELVCVTIGAVIDARLVHKLDAESNNELSWARSLSFFLNKFDCRPILISFRAKRELVNKRNMQK